MRATIELPLDEGLVDFMRAYEEEFVDRDRRNDAIIWLSPRGVGSYERAVEWQKEEAWWRNYVYHLQMGLKDGSDGAGIVREFMKRVSREGFRATALIEDGDRFLWMIADGKGNVDEREVVLSKETVERITERVIDAIADAMREELNLGDFDRERVKRVIRNAEVLYETFGSMPDNWGGEIEYEELPFTFDGDLPSLIKSTVKEALFGLVDVGREAERRAEQERGVEL